MSLKKILIAGVAAAIFNIIIGMLTCGGVFNWVYQVEPTNVWKPVTEETFGLGYLLGELFLNIIFVYVYALFYRGIPGFNKYVKGLVYGLAVWGVGTLPGMFATAGFMTVANVVVVYWTIWALVVLPLKGMLVSAIYGESVKD
ncbi:MAG: hypothetical protein A2Y25_09990 [Candidatus Melainabacteria bacterium GWF2_37_15]|nr:MAG: hypothetical protein A2Y25_09990 [Candidatus Melainabacteria bacterium GWF2_37_15]